MKTMRAAEIRQPGGPLQLVERDLPSLAMGHVLIKVQACGICHSDAFTKEGMWPGIQYPRVPGHEITGVIDAVGSDVSEWKPGQRVGVGWHGGHCGRCEPCRRGDFILCHHALVPGISYDGGYATHMVAPIEALARIPDDLSNVEAAPLLCAGITTYNSLRNSGARPGDVVAVLGALDPPDEHVALGQVGAQVGRRSVHHPGDVPASARANHRFGGRPSARQ